MERIAKSWWGNADHGSRGSLSCAAQTLWSRRKAASIENVIYIVHVLEMGMANMGVFDVHWRVLDTLPNDEVSDHLKLIKFLPSTCFCIICTPVLRFKKRVLFQDGGNVFRDNSGVVK